MLKMANLNAFYLKYRPQNLEEVIGQESVKKFLLPSFANNKLSHAYLFVGPRGTGKTSTARILAKMANCEEKNPPCNKCQTCLTITDGSNLDLIEIDAASNRGIEDIRSLREKIKLAPSSLKKKIYIIDEVHMLTGEAFNALLKTLEEPPSHVMFILATTEIAKIPETILSRVQRLDFKLGTAQELKKTLLKVVQAEKINIDEEALNLLVKQADGSFRDGVKLLEQVSVLGEKVTISSIEESFRSGQFEQSLDLLNNFLNKNSASALLNINSQLEMGISAKSIILNLMDLMRSLVLIQNGAGEQLVKVHFTEDKYEILSALAQNFTGSPLIKNLEILQNAFEKLKFSSIPSLSLELAAIQICTWQAPATGIPSQTIISKEQDETVIKLVKDDAAIPLSISDSPDIVKLKEKWTFVLETIRPYNFSLEALLRSISIADCTDREVKLEVPYSFHQRILEAPKNRDLLESIISDILGRNIKLLVVLGNRPQRAEDLANIELAADDEIIRAAAEIFSSDTVN